MVVTGTGATAGTLPIQAKGEARRADNAGIIVVVAADLAPIPESIGGAFRNVVAVVAEVYGASGRTARACAGLKRHAVMVAERGAGFGFAGRGPWQITERQTRAGVLG